MQDNEIFVSAKFIFPERFICIIQIKVFALCSQSKFMGRPKLKMFKIETFDTGGYFTFLTKAKDHKVALSNLLNNSSDYKNIVSHSRTLTIKVIEIKD